MVVVVKKLFVSGLRAFRMFSFKFHGEAAYANVEWIIQYRGEI